MQSFVAAFLCVALVCVQFSISNGGPNDEDQPATINAEEEKGGAEGTGIAAYPVRAFRSSRFGSYIQALVNRFNQLAGSDAYTYTLENQSNKETATLVGGRFILVFANGETDVVDKVLLEDGGHVLDPENKLPRTNVLGIMGGGRKRLLDLPDETLNQIKKGLQQCKAILNNALGDIWIIGSPAFDKDLASVAENNAKVIPDLNRKSPIEKAIDAALWAPGAAFNLMIAVPTKTFAVVNQGVKDGATFAGNVGTNVVKGSTQAAKSSVGWVGNLGRKNSKNNEEVPKN